MVQAHGAKGFALQKDVRRAMLKFIVLRQMQIGEIHPYALAKKISESESFRFIRSNSAASIKNDVYNTINVLERSGYIKIKAQTSKGRLKKYYVLTPTGKHVLGDAKNVFIKAMQQISKMM